MVYIDLETVTYSIKGIYVSYIQWPNVAKQAMPKLSIKKTSINVLQSTWIVSLIPCHSYLVDKAFKSPMDFSGILL